MPVLTVANESFEEAIGTSWVVVGPGVAIERIEDEEAPDGDWVLEVETALEGWEGIGGVRTASVNVEAGKEYEITVLVKLHEDRTIYPSISERNGEDVQIAFHKGEGVKGETGFFIEVTAKATFTTGTKARLFLEMDGPTEPDKPFFYVDKRPEVWPPPPPDLRVSDGFEDDFAKWTELQEIGETATGEIITTKPLIQTKSFKATIGPGDERCEVYKLTNNSVLYNGDEGYVRFVSRLEGDPGGIGVMMQLHNSGDDGSPPIEIARHRDTGRIVLEGGPGGEVPFSVDWWGPLAGDILGKRIEYIVGFKLSTDPEEGYVKLWVNRRPQRLTLGDGTGAQSGKNNGTTQKFKRTFHTDELHEPPYLYLKTGNYENAGPTAVGSHVVDGVVMSMDEEDIFTKLKRWVRIEEEAEEMTRFVSIEGEAVEA